MQYTLSSNWSFCARVVSSLITDRNAVKVFPDPVGDEISILFFLWMSMIDCFCAGVKSWNCELNHF